LIKCEELGSVGMKICDLNLWKQDSFFIFCGLLQGNCNQIYFDTTRWSTDYLCGSREYC